MLALLAVESVFLAKFAADRGAALWPRYLMGEALLLLPFAALALAASLRPPPLALAAAVLALAAMPASTWWHQPDLYLVRAIPDATRAAAAWVAAQPGEPAFLMTRMSWQSSYLPVLDRLPPDRYRVLSDWLPDDELRDFVRDRRPAFVLTRADDAGLLAKLCPVAGTMPLADRHLATFDRIVALPLDPARCALPP
jgi:hypothetical protein